MNDIEREARRRAHGALMDKVTCWEPGELRDGLSHDWVCDAVTDEIEGLLRVLALRPKEETRGGLPPSDFGIDTRVPVLR